MKRTKKRRRKEKKKEGGGRRKEEKVPKGQRGLLSKFDEFLSGGIEEKLGLLILKCDMASLVN